MKLRLIPPAAALVALCAGCAPHRIPGTDIEDNPENHAVLDVLEQYRTALEDRDAGKLLALVSEQFKDTGGTTNPEDDLDYAALRHKLPERLAKVDEVKVELNVRRLTINKDTANVVYYFNSHYRLPRLANKALSEGDLQQMWLKRVDGKWKILSGI